MYHFIVNEGEVCLIYIPDFYNLRSTERKRHPSVCSREKALSILEAIEQGTECPCRCGRIFKGEGL